MPSRGIWHHQRTRIKSICTATISSTATKITKPKGSGGPRKRCTLVPIRLGQKHVITGQPRVVGSGGRQKIQTFMPGQALGRIVGSANVGALLPLPPPGSGARSADSGQGARSWGLIGPDRTPSEAKLGGCQNVRTSVPAAGMPVSKGI